MLEVVDPGPLLSIQDRGRPGLGHLGVPPSGACDGWGLAVANVLAGAPAGLAGDWPAAEITLGGTELRVLATCAIALAGADLAAERDDGVPLATGATHVLPAGSRVRFRGPPSGMRAYLALAGGVRAPRVLGSAATSPVAGLGGLGGLDGAPLRAGDRLEPVHRGDLSAAGRHWPEAIAPHPAAERGPVPLVPGPDLRHLPPEAADALAGARWRVGAATDRMGMRLEGPRLRVGGEILSHPVVPGAVQVPGDGHPLILLADGPTIGGYPVAGVVPRAALPRLGQARPGDELAFMTQDAEAARAAWREQRRRFAAGVDAVHADAIWHRLVDHAEG